MVCGWSGLSWGCVMQASVGGMRARNSVWQLRCVRQLVGGGALRCCGFGVAAVVGDDKKAVFPKIRI